MFKTTRATTDNLQAFKKNDSIQYPSPQLLINFPYKSLNEIHRILQDDKQMTPQKQKYFRLGYIDHKNFVVYTCKYCKNVIKVDIVVKEKSCENIQQRSYYIRQLQNIHSHHRLKRSGATNYESEIELEFETKIRYLSDLLLSNKIQLGLIKQEEITLPEIVKQNSIIVTMFCNGIYNSKEHFGRSVVKSELFIEDVKIKEFFEVKNLFGNKNKFKWLSLLKGLTCAIANGVVNLQIFVDKIILEELRSQPKKSDQVEILIIKKLLKRYYSRICFNKEKDFLLDQYSNTVQFKIAKEQEKQDKNIIADNEEFGWNSLKFNKTVTDIQTVCTN